jgi:hypothetical protein
MSASELKVVTDDWKKFSPVNYLLHSMFKQITVKIGQTQVNCFSGKYPYIA